MANHTSPIDVIILASDGYYAMVRLLPMSLGHCHAARGDASGVPADLGQGRGRVLGTKEELPCFFGILAVFNCSAFSY